MTNFIYNTTASTNDGAGWFSAVSDYCTLLVGLGTLNATDLTYRIEGRNSSGYTRIASIAADVLTSTTTKDTIVTVNDHFDEIRVGVKVTNDDGTATPNNFHTGIILTEMR